MKLSRNRLAGYSLIVVNLLALAMITDAYFIFWRSSSWESLVSPEQARLMDQSAPKEQLIRLVDSSDVTIRATDSIAFLLLDCWLASALLNLLGALWYLRYQEQKAAPK
jgi:hypothetical protein